MKNYITHILQILNFSSHFRRSEIKNSLRRPTKVADNISNLLAPQNLFEDILHPYIYNTIRYKEPNILYFIDKKEDH